MKNHIEDIQQLWSSTGLIPVQGLFIAAGVIAVGLSIPSFQKHQARIEADKAKIAEITQQQRQLQIQFEAEQEQATIAEQRYKTCLPVVGQEFKNGTHYFVGIQPGVVIRDRVSNKPLAQGTVICDANGTTATISADGTPQHFAYTGDRNIVQQRLKRFRGSQFSNPVVELKWYGARK